MKIGMSSCNFYMFRHLKQVLKGKNQTYKCHSNAVVLAAVQGVHCRMDLSNAGPMGFLPKFRRFF